MQLIACAYHVHLLSVKPTRCAWKSHAINCTALASIPKHTNTVYYKHTVKGIFTQNKNDPMIYYPSSHPRCIWLSSFGFFLSHPFRGPLLITQSVCGVQGLKKKKTWAWTFFPGGGLVAEVNTFAGLFGKQKTTKLFEWFSMKLRLRLLKLYCSK